MSDPAFYHGGIPGLRVGQHILPPDQTGAVTVADVPDAPEAMQAEVERVHRRDRVYLTTTLGVAELWACYYPNGHPTRGGDVYRVEPEGEIEPDPDYLLDDGASVCAPQARIVAIVRTGVRRALGARLMHEHGGALPDLITHDTTDRT